MLSGKNSSRTKRSMLFGVTGASVVDLNKGKTREDHEEMKRASPSSQLDVRKDALDVIVATQTRQNSALRSKNTVKPAWIDKEDDKKDDKKTVISSTAVMSTVVVPTAAANTAPKTTPQARPRTHKSREIPPAVMKKALVGSFFISSDRISNVSLGSADVLPPQLEEPRSPRGAVALGAKGY